MSGWTGWEVYVDEERKSWGLREVPGGVFIIDFGCLPGDAHGSLEMQALGCFIKARAQEWEGPAKEMFR